MWRNSRKQMDKNLVILSGVSGDDVKFARATNGKEYCTFLLLISTFDKELGDESPNSRGMDMIRILVFNNKRGKLVDYLKKVGFRRGMRVTVMGRLQSYKSEVHGVTIIQNNVMVRDIECVMTKSYKEKKTKENINVEQ